MTVNLDQLLDIGHLRDVSVHMWGVGMPSIPVFRWILASFRSCRPASQLEIIHFIVSLAGTSRPDTEQDFGFWNALDGALSGSQFERLRSIRVDIGVPETVRHRSPRQSQYSNLRTWDPRLMGQIGKSIEKQFASGGRRRMLSVQVDKLMSDETVSHVQQHSSFSTFFSTTKTTIVTPPPPNISGMLIRFSDITQPYPLRTVPNL